VRPPRELTRTRAGELPINGVESVDHLWVWTIRTDKTLLSSGDSQVVGCAEAVQTHTSRWQLLHANADTATAPMTLGVIAALWKF